MLQEPMLTVKIFIPFTILKEIEELAHLLAIDYDNDKLISETKYNEAEKYLNESALEKGDLGLYNYAEVITYLEKLSK